MPNGEVTITWGDGEHKFNIAKIGQVLELEEKCGCGVATILHRLRTGTFYLNDFRETLRLGLIGGSMEPAKAAMLVKRYVDDRPWQESVMPAMAVLMRAMVGVPGDEVGKKPTAEQTATEPSQATETSTMAGLSAPPSTDSALPSDSPHDRSTSSPFGSFAPASTGSTAPTA